MKHNPPRRRGISFALLLAGATFAVGVLSGVFLLYDSAPTLRPGIPLDFALPQAQPEARNLTRPHTDHTRAKPQHLARVQHSRHAKRA